MLVADYHQPFVENVQYLAQIMKFRILLTAVCCWCHINSKVGLTATWAHSSFGQASMQRHYRKAWFLTSWLAHRVHQHTSKLYNTLHKMKRHPAEAQHTGGNYLKTLTLYSNADHQHKIKDTSTKHPKLLQQYYAAAATIKLLCYHTAAVQLESSNRAA